MRTIKAKFDPSVKTKFDVKVRDKQFEHGYKIVTTENGRGMYPRLKEVVDCRVYWSTGTTCYCAIWVNDMGKPYGGIYTQGTGKAGGYGYDKRSAAVGDAIRNAGISLDVNISGVGSEAVVEALLAIGRMCTGKRVYLVEAFG